MPRRMSEKLQVSVVVATHNRPERLGALLDTLSAQTLPRDAFEVIVVNDASTDGTAEFLRERGQRDDLPLRSVHRERSQGPAVARNEGWRAARAPLVAFTDDDCIVGPRWLESAVAVAKEHPGAIVQGRTDPIPEEYPRYGPFSHTLTIHRAGPS